MATVYIPTHFRRLTGGQSRVTVDAADIDSLISTLDEQYPGIAERLLDGDGKVKRFVNVFVNDDEIRTRQGMATPVGENDKISIVPAMAGGAIQPEQS
jgi:molybdopterin synthase sulfur carrier subunit